MIFQTMGLCLLNGCMTDLNFFGSVCQIALGMQSPTKGQILYQLPSCTICLQELLQDLSCLDCGHVFHLGCIYQHFEYRGSCPNCQKRAGKKEMRALRLLYTPHTRTPLPTLPVLTHLSPNEKQQWETLMGELKLTNETNEKLKQHVSALQGEVRSKSKAVEGLREQVNRLKDEWDRLTKENRKLNNDCKQLSNEINQHMRTGRSLRLQVQRLHAEEKEFEQMRRFKQLLAENSQEIVKYKAELEARYTPPEEVAKTFYDMLLMKNLEILRAKEKLSQIPERFKEKDLQLTRSQQMIQTLRKEARETADKRAAEKKRYDELRERYRQISEKARQKGFKETDIPAIDQNSQGFSNKSISEHLLIESVTRKPYLGYGSTIGGFLTKKKDDKLKTTL